MVAKLSYLLPSARVPCSAVSTVCRSVTERLSACWKRFASMIAAGLTSIRTCFTGLITRSPIPFAPQTGREKLESFLGMINTPACNADILCNTFSTLAANQQEEIAHTVWRLSKEPNQPRFGETTIKKDPKASIVTQAVNVVIAKQALEQLSSCTPPYRDQLKNLPPLVSAVLKELIRIQLPPDHKDRLKAPDRILNNSGDPLVTKAISYAVGVPNELLPLFSGQKSVGDLTGIISL